VSLTMLTILALALAALSFLIPIIAGIEDPQSALYVGCPIWVAWAAALGYAFAKYGKRGGLTTLSWSAALLAIYFQAGLYYSCLTHRGCL
jgi:hypothetical protein